MLPKRIEVWVGLHLQARVACGHGILEQGYGSIRIRPGLGDLLLGYNPGGQGVSRGGIVKKANSKNRVLFARISQMSHSALARNLRHTP
jgi:hypothetical protein